MDTNDIPVVDLVPPKAISQSRKKSIPTILINEDEFDFITHLSLLHPKLLMLIIKIHKIMLTWLKHLGLVKKK